MYADTINFWTQSILISTIIVFVIFLLVISLLLVDLFSHRLNVIKNKKMLSFLIIILSIFCLIYSAISCRTIYLLQKDLKVQSFRTATVTYHSSGTRYSSIQGYAFTVITDDGEELVIYANLDFCFEEGEYTGTITYGMGSKYLVDSDMKKSN